MATSYYRKKRNRLGFISWFIFLVVLFILGNILYGIFRSHDGYASAKQQYEAEERRHMVASKKLADTKFRQNTQVTDLEVVNNKEVQEIHFRGVTGDIPDEDRAFRKEDTRFYVYPTE